MKIGVSSCLLGEQVRFDGGHKRDSFLVDTFGKYAEWTTVCPEVEIGLGIPRDSLRLTDSGSGTRLIITKTGEDLTQRMTEFSEKRAKEITRLKLAGYVLKAKSPSCGMERVKVYHPGTMPDRGVGLFAAALLKACPHLPVEEEGRLQDPGLRENFVTRVFTYQRWLDMAELGLTRARLMKFHEQHKFILFSHNQAGSRALGNLLGQGGSASDYLDKLTDVMKRTPTRKNHTNVLQHLAGFLKDRIDDHDRKELGDVIERYRQGLLPLIVPITLLRHHVVKLDVDYLRDQIYLNPHPHELMLLNHV